MASQPGIEIETESPPLFNYLKMEIPLEDIKDYASPRRINSIDFVKGFAIVFIILAHTASGWLDLDSYYVYGLMFALLDILGPSLFVFLSALSVIFSIKRKEGLVHPKIIRNRVFTRGLVMIIIGMITNIAVIEPGQGLEIAIYGWNIITFIGVSQICSYYILKIRKSWRIIIGIIIIIISPTIRALLYLGKVDGNILCIILHYIITSETPHLTLIPWISISFISTIFGEYIYEAMNKSTKDAYIGLFRIFFVWGIIFILIGIFAYFPDGLNLAVWEPGWTLEWVSPTDPTDSSMIGGLYEYPHLVNLIYANLQDFYVIPGMPNFLIRGTSANMFYNQGAALLIIAIFFYFIDIKQKSNNFINMLIYFGKTSLSLFLIHFLFIPMFLRQFNIPFFLIVSLSYIGFLGIFMYIWMEYGKGVGSPEYLMVQLGRIGQKSGEAVKKTTKKMYAKIKKREKVKKMEDFMKKLSKDAGDE